MSRFDSATLKAAPDAGAAAKITANAGVSWLRLRKLLAVDSRCRFPQSQCLSIEDGQPLYDSRLHGQVLLKNSRLRSFKLSGNRRLTFSGPAGATVANSILHVLAVACSCPSRTWPGLARTVRDRADSHCFFFNRFGCLSFQLELKVRLPHIPDARVAGQLWSRTWLLRRFCMS